MTTKVSVVDRDTRADRLAEIYLLVGPLYRRAHRHVEVSLQAHGVSVGVRAILDLLLRGGAMTVPQLGRAQSLSRQFVQRMVNEAVAAGLVELTENPAHRRSRLVGLTATGRTAIEGVAAREHAQLADVGADLTADDLAACARVLTRMLDGLAELDD